jgi:hypothetical protein
VSFTRELFHAGVYALCADRARERTGRGGPFHEGASFAAVLPARLLRLNIRFPAGAWPADVTVHAWPMSTAPDPSNPGLASQLHPRGFELAQRPRARTITLSVEHPLVGAKYGIAWRLPE